MRVFSLWIAALVLAGLFLAGGAAHAQVGDLIWEENFDNLDNWIKLTGNGGWGWGNGELQFYKEDNVDIAAVPGEPGNGALRITARMESGPGIVDQWGNPLSYTSGRVMSKSHVAIKYGMIETRVRVPDLDLGGWPAVWLLGTSNYAWPRSGEIDLMEMGSTQAFRDLHDTHNGGNGLNNSTVNQVVGANAIYYSDAAVNPGNPSGAASLSWDPDDDFCRPYYNYAAPLVERFLTYRLYWDDANLRFTVTDGGVEYDLYTVPFAIDGESDEFRSPFYLIVNLAIGGAFTDAYNLGDPGSGAPVSMPFPAEMYVDYIRVYEWNNQGEVVLGPPAPEAGSFGIYTDLTPTNGGLEAQVTSQIYVWEGTLTGGSIAPYEGGNVLSWQTAGLGWFGAGIMSIQPLNLFDFPDGHLNFRIKIPANVTFKIGIIDVWGNQSWMPFPAYQTTYGLVRNGEWGQASIPVTDIRGTLMDLRMLSYPFAILEENGTPCEFALDDIYYDGGAATGIADGGPGDGYPVRLFWNSPNPFNPTTRIRFQMTAGDPYEITIFDISGRRVAGFRGVGIAGMNSVTWDGRDAAGSPAASGVYFYSLTAGAYRATKKMVLLK
jgi:beta-glucanase (GH16 family)